jgi:hypothetical protein
VDRETADEIKRQFNVVAEGLGSEIRTVAEGLSATNEKIDRLESRIARPDGGGAMTDSRVASDDDPASAGMLWWAETWRRWLGALNTFLERAFRSADVDTGC